MAALAPTPPASPACHAASPDCNAGGVRPFYAAEFLEQCRFILVSCAVSLALTGLGWGTIVALEAGNFFKLASAEWRIGGFMVLANVREFAAVATGLMVAAVCGTAITADLGARKVRDELEAISVMGTPRTTTPAAVAAEPTIPAIVEEPAPVPAPSAAADTAAPVGARRRGVSGRRRAPAAPAKEPDKGAAAPGPRRPGVSGRRRRGPGPRSGSGGG
jgi:Permease MlaE